MTNFIEFENVTFGYEIDGEVARNVLENFSFSVRRGEFVAILGHNGCGKSTVAKLCNGIEVPQQGRVVVDGLDTAEEENLLAIRQKVGVVFQNPDNQIVATIVEDDVAFGPENLGVAPAEIRERVDDALKRVEMYAFRKFEPHKLSGGQKQRVAIAGVIAMQPACIVLDEPTAMLDPRGRKDVMNTIRMLNEQYGITVLLITHYMDEAAQAQRVIVMDRGAILLDDTPRAVFRQSELLHKAGLELPQTAQLAALLRKDGFSLAPDVLYPDELCDAICGNLNEGTNGGACFVKRDS